MWKYKDLFLFEKRNKEEIGELHLIVQIMNENPMSSEGTSQVKFLKNLFKRKRFNTRRVN
jgi:hypothetical protein